MASEKKKSYVKEVLIGGISGFLGSLLWDWYTKTPILTSLKWIWNKAVLLLNYEVKVWWVLSGILLIILIRYLYKIANDPSSATFTIRHTIKRQPDTQSYRKDDIPIEILDAMNADNERDYLEAKEREAAMLNYTADKFDGLIWKWAWVFNKIINRYEVKKAHAICPKDNLPLVYEENRELGIAFYRCQICGEGQRASYTKQEIAELVEGKYNLNSH